MAWDDQFKCIQSDFLRSDVSRSCSRDCSVPSHLQEQPPPELPFGCMATYEQKSILNSQPLYFHSFIPIRIVRRMAVFHLILRVRSPPVNPCKTTIQASCPRYRSFLTMQSTVDRDHIMPSIPSGIFFDNRSPTLPNHHFLFFRNFYSRHPT